MIVCGRELRVRGRLIRIARLDAEKYLFLDDPVSFIEDLRKSGERIDLFTFVERLAPKGPKYNYPVGLDNFAAIPITTFDNWWNKQIGFKARNKAKQGEKKGVVCREVPFDAALVRGIWQIYNECPVRQGRPFTHFGKSLDAVYKEEATYLDRSVFIGAFLGDQLIGFVKMVSDEAGTQSGLMNIVSMIRHRDKAPTNALVAQAVRSCAERRISYLVYSNFAYGNKGRDSVVDFKVRNAFQRFDVPRYYVPLTLLGRIAFGMGLHKRFLDRVPEPIVAKIRGLRSLWYNRKLASAV